MKNKSNESNSSLDDSNDDAATNCSKEEQDETGQQQQQDSDDESETKPLCNTPETVVKGTNSEIDEESSTTIWSSIANIYSDQSGSFRNLVQGLSLMLFFGILLGIIMPKDYDNLSTVWYPYLSAIIGYTYFMAWSVSYYPQVITNYQRHSISGLSTDYTIFLVLNSLCYAIYNCYFFWGDSEKTITVEGNDVAFSIHALIITLVLLIQSAYYGGFTIHPISTTSIIIMALSILTLVLYSIGIVVLRNNNWFQWIYVLYALGFLKTLLASASYIPQLLLNYKRQSTSGFNMWNIYLDFSGGFLSTLQLILDSLFLKQATTFQDGLEQNWAKLLLGLITLVFDSVFLVQHFILYRSSTSTASPENSILDIMEQDYIRYEDLETTIV